MHETAAQHSVKRVPVAEATETVATVKARLHDRAYDNIDYVWVIDRVGRLYGAVALPALLEASPTAHVSTLMQLSPVRVPPECDQEHAALAALRSGPLATIIQDVLSLLIYFAIATALIR
jgi:Mg/Co/Ni transporter MgtE